MPAGGSKADTEIPVLDPNVFIVDDPGHALSRLRRECRP